MGRYIRRWLIEMWIDANSRKGKQMYDKELQSFNLRSSVLIRVLSDKYYSVELCVGFTHFRSVLNLMAFVIAISLFLRY